MDTAAETQNVLIVGTSVAGVSTAEALRRRGHTGPLTLIDAEDGLPYDRPPLSKQYLSGAWNETDVALRSWDALLELGAVIRRGERATGLDVEARTVHTATDSFRADHVVIATGVHPRAVPGQHLQGTHVLRTLADAGRLREAIRQHTGPLVVIGHGVLGSEVAATAAQLGEQVVLIGSGPAPMSAMLGDLGTRTLRSMHDLAGVTMLNDHRVQYIHGDGDQADGVILDDGTFVAAAAVVVAVGSSPSVGWLEESPLDVSDGVRCDSRGSAAHNVWAVGDVARFDHLGWGGPLRLENRTNAVEMAQAVAGNILGDDTPYLPVPYFWTDQYGVRIQLYGQIPATASLSVVAGDPAEGRFVAVATNGAQAVGVLGWGMPKQARLHSTALQEQNDAALLTAGV